MRRPSRDFTTESIPAWYHLSFSGSFLSIIVHPMVLPMIAKFCTLQEKFFAMLRQKYWLLDEFVDLNANAFGFGGVLKRVGEYRGWTRFRLELPVIYEPGRQNDASRIVTNVRVTLNTFFNMLWLFPLEEGEIDTDCFEPQLVVIDNVMLGVGNGDAGIGATITPTMWKYLASNSKQFEEEGLRALKEAYYHMIQKTPSTAHRFEVSISTELKTFSIHLPGDACYLSSDSPADDKLPIGFKIDSHNMDGAEQQLASLAVLFALSDLVRKVK